MDVLVLVQPSVVPREVFRAVNVVGFSPGKYERNPNDKNTSSLRKKFLKYVPQVLTVPCDIFVLENTYRLYEAVSVLFEDSRLFFFKTGQILNDH